MTFSGRILGLIVLATTVTSCAEQQNTNTAMKTQGAHQGELQLLSTDRLTVIDDIGVPIANASILVGFEPGVPFEGNVLTTDAAGVASIPADWKDALPLTVQAPGFITSTLPISVPGQLTLQLLKQDATNEFEVKGVATNFPRLVTDGKVDFALMIPALSRDNLLAFDLSTVISPKVDTITIIGNDVNLPSNISLPQQTENYIFPIELNKPEYRVYLRNPGVQTLTATHGQFPLQRVVNDIRAGKSMFELINHFTFIEGGQKELDVQGNLIGQDVAVNQVPFNTQVAVRAPTFDADQQMVNLALVEQNGMLIPTDLKRINTGQSLNMKSFGTAPMMFSFLVNVTKNAKAFLNQPFSWFKPLMDLDRENFIVSSAVAKQDFTQLSFAFLSATGGVAPQFLPLIAKPTLTGDVLALTVPTLPAGLTPVATYLVMSEIETTMVGNVASEKRTRLWEVWSTTWLSQVELPKISFTKRPDRTYRWEVLFMARPANFVGAAVPSSRIDLSTVTHVTRNALDL
jgi:hypothetical protein